MDRDIVLRRFEAEYLEMNSIHPRRRRNQLNLLTRLAADLDHPLNELTAQDIATFFGAELSRGLHPNSVRTNMGMVRSFASWLRDAGLATPEATDRLKAVRYPRGSSGYSTPNPYKVAEIREFRTLLAEKYPAVGDHGRGSRMLPRLLAGKTNRMHSRLLRHAKRLQFEAQIALALEAGLRRIEIVRLTIPAMHYDNDEVVVMTAKQRPGGQKVRTIPYTTHARNCVQEWLDFRFLLKPPHDQPWLMLDYTGNLAAQVEPQTYRALSRSLERFGDKWRWHRFRHTAATEWLRSGVALEKVSIMMGHSSLEQTRAYTQILNSDISHAFGKAEADFAKRLGLAA